MQGNPAPVSVRESSIKNPALMGSCGTELGFLNPKSSVTPVGNSCFQVDVVCLVLSTL